MGKVYAILYSLILLLALITRSVECFFEALLESKLVNWGFFKESFVYNWNDERKYTSIDDHLDRVRILWNN